MYARAFVAEKLYLIRREEGRIDRVSLLKLNLLISDSMKTEWKGYFSSYLGTLRVIHPQTLLQQKDTPNWTMGF